MSEQSLITISEVSEYRKIDPKFNQERFDTFVSEAQQKNLREFLGGALYYDMFNNLTAEKYTKLISGDTYEYEGYNISFYGIKPFLCYIVLSIMAREGNLFLSHVGAIQYNNNTQQSYEDSKDKQRLAVQFIETANRYKDEAINYIETNASTYPSYNGNDKINSNNFFTFKV